MRAKKGRPVRRTGMITCRKYIRTQHTENIENYTENSQSVTMLQSRSEKQGTYGTSYQNTD